MDRIINLCGPGPRGTGLQNLREAIIQTKWKYDLAMEDKQVLPSTRVVIKGIFALGLSSPRAKRAGPKGLRAESARAFTGRLNSHSGRGEDFLTGRPDFFTETAVTPERKVEKWFPRWEINRHVEG